MDYGAIDLNKGGSAIPYCEEDESIRREFEATLAARGRRQPHGGAVLRAVIRRGLRAGAIDVSSRPSVEYYRDDPSNVARRMLP